MSWLGRAKVLEATASKLSRMAELKNKKLEGKVAIVTGGASGIGEVTARQFALHGARAVVIAYVQDQKGLDVAASIGPHCNYIHCDVTDEGQVKSLVDSTVQMHGCFDIMFSNAGMFSSSEQTVLAFDLSSYDRLMAVNGRGMAACVKHAALAMVEGGVKGSIICTASVVASTGLEWFTDYTMSRHAILGLMRSASIQLAAHGIRVNCVSPGPCQTPLMNKYFESKAVEEMTNFTASVEQTEFMSPDHVANAVVFPASEDSEFVTGHNLVINGGRKA